MWTRSKFLAIGPYPPKLELEVDLEVVVTLEDVLADSVELDEAVLLEDLDVVDSLKLEVE